MPPATRASELQSFGKSKRAACSGHASIKSSPVTLSCVFRSRLHRAAATKELPDAVGPACTLHQVHKGDIVYTYGTHMRMYVCMYVCVYEYIYIYMYACMPVCMYTHVSVCVCVDMYIYIYIHIYIYMCGCMPVKIRSIDWQTGIDRQTERPIEHVGTCCVSR